MNAREALVNAEAEFRRRAAEQMGRAERTEMAGGWQDIHNDALVLHAFANHCKEALLQLERPVNIDALRLTAFAMLSFVRMTHEAHKDSPDPTERERMRLARALITMAESLGIKGE